MTDHLSNAYVIRVQKSTAFPNKQCRDQYCDKVWVTQQHYGSLSRERVSEKIAKMKKYGTKTAIACITKPMRDIDQGTL